MRKRYISPAIFFFFFLILAFAIFFFFRFIQFSDADKIIRNKSTEEVLTFFLLSHGGEENGKKIQPAAYLLFYYLPKNYVHVFNINTAISLYENGENKKLFENNKTRSIIEKLSQKFKVKIHFYCEVRRENAKKMMNAFGGVEIFNNYSKNYPLGRYFINGNNYMNFLAGIGHPILKIDTAYSVWYNLFYNTLNFYSKMNHNKGVSWVVRKYISTDLSRNSFNLLFEHLVKNYDKMYVTYSRMNVEMNDVGTEKMVFPLDDGRYDQKKLLDLLDNFKVEEKEINQFPINLQVKNTTSVGRLAAKTAGVLRRKKCNVIEYLNSEVKLSNSLIIDRCGSSIKRDYIKKITRIDDVYYSIDYREKFDFSIFLGSDYYGIRR